MPIDPTGTHNGATWAMAIVGPDDISFKIEVETGMQTEGQSDDAIQSLLDHLDTLARSGVDHSRHQDDQPPPRDHSHAVDRQAS